MEEATLRAKIQAMKNLLEVKQQSQLPKATKLHHTKLDYGHFQAVSGLVNRSWDRFSGPKATTTQSHVAEGSVNKVWRRESALTKQKLSVPATKAWKRPVKMAAKKRKSIQLQVLRLEDGEYAKARGGYSLVRAEVKKPTVTNLSQAVASANHSPASNSNSKSVHFDGVKDFANGSKVLKRCSTGERIESTKHRRLLSSTNATTRAALSRATATVRNARSKPFRTKDVHKARTEYCSFYNRFGYCKNKDECRFIHDSRRVTMCRKFLKNECKDFKCLLSHQHDENKVPDCKMFLRGACTRESCKYRHVKVSATADLCAAFTKGYCPTGVACLLRHELSQALPAPSGSALATESPRNYNADLLIRPDIRFTSKHSSDFPSLFDDLRRAAN